MPRESLSERQLECLDLAGEGLTSKRIAIRLGISHHTVDQHIKAAMTALGVRSRGAAIALIRRAPASPELVSHANDLPNAPLSGPFGGQDAPAADAARVGEQSRVREARLDFLAEHPVPVPGGWRSRQPRSVLLTVLLIVVLAVLFPVLLLGAIALADAAFRLPIG